MADFLFMIHCDFLSISHRLKVIMHSNFRWDFSVWGTFWRFWGAKTPKCEFWRPFPPKARVSTEPRRLMHITSLTKVASDLLPARGKKGGRRKSQKFDKRPSRGGATAQLTSIFFRRSNVLPDVVTSAKLWF